MSNLTFKFPMGIAGKCSLSGFEGIIHSRVQHINGSLQYGVQPKARKGSFMIPDAYMIDETGITVEKTPKPETVKFLYETGDKVRNRVNGFEGIITSRIQYLNGCIAYMVEGQMREGKEVKFKAWEQELATMDKGLNAKEEAPIARRKTGGPSVRECQIHKAM